MMTRRSGNARKGSVKAPARGARKAKGSVVAPARPKKARGGKSPKAAVGGGRKKMGKMGC